MKLGTMKQVVLAAALCGAAAAYAAEPMKSSELEVRFDGKTHEPDSLVNVRTGDRLALTPESAFRLEFYKIGTTIADLAKAIDEKKAELIAVDARDCKTVNESQEVAADGLTIRRIVYGTDHGAVTVTYTLGREDHFIQKEIRFDPSFAEPYLLWRVEAQRFRLPEKPKEYVPWVHGGCVTHFLQGEKGGFFCGIQNPLLVPFPETAPQKATAPKEALLDPADTSALAYAVNFRFGAKEPYLSEKIFWGCYGDSKASNLPGAEAMLSMVRQSKTYLCSPVVHLPGSEAMLSMVRRLAPPTRKGIKVALNGWQSKLSRCGYGAAAVSKDVENDKRILATAKENLGDFEAILAVTWGGLDPEVVKQLTPADTVPPETTGAKEMLAWARGEKIGINMWSLHGTVSWGAMAYCPQKKDWQLIGRKNGRVGGLMCPANRDFMRWHNNLVVGMIRRGYASWAEDELVGGDGRVLCHAVGHDHLPGDASYGWFRMRQELYRTLKKEFGDDFPIHGYRPQMDLGIWECLLVDNVFTLNEFGSGGGRDRIRVWARIRHDYHFLPSYKDQALIGRGSTDYDMLSALAVSSTYLFYGTGDATAKKWLTWARAHPDHMGAQAIFLPNDVYLRLVNGSGFAFLFNAGGGEDVREIPLDASVGLDPAKTYRLSRVFPEKGQFEKTTVQGRWTAKLPARAAWLLAIEPAEKGAP